MARGSNTKKRSTVSSPLSELSDDLLVEIISRMPYKTTRCCKCVCRRWRDIVSHPEHRKKLPRSTLAGFFYEAYDRNRDPRLYHGYQSVSGNWCPRVDPSLSFLPRYQGQRIEMLDCCNGLLLCRQRSSLLTLDYVVCNTASEKCVTLPANNKASIARLGFDPAVSSHFHVFEFVADCVWDVSKRSYSRRIETVGIYSSEDGVWTHRSAWERPIAFYNNSRSAFLNGVLYLSSYIDLVIAVIDLEGNYRVICCPTAHIGSHDLYLSRGHLYLAAIGGYELSIWALEDYISENWILQHKVSNLQLFGKEYSLFASHYRVIIHPEHSVIFIVCTTSRCSQLVTKLLSYELDSKELHFVSDLGCCRGPYLPYVPLFSKSLTHGHEES